MTAPRHGVWPPSCEAPRCDKPMVPEARPVTVDFGAAGTRLVVRLCAEHAARWTR